MPSHEIFSQEDKDKFRFWNTPPPDPQTLAKNSEAGYHPRNSLGRDRILMPTSPMPVGEHANKIMQAVPADYLRWVNEQPWAARWPAWAPVADYLQRFPVGPWLDGPPGNAIFVDSLLPCRKSQHWRFDEISHLTCGPGMESLLHAFAIGALGLRRDWFQPREYLGHYDLSPAKHQAAIAAGAHLLASREALRAHIHTAKLYAARQTCTKHCYASEQEADRVAHERLTARRNAPTYLRSYLCPRCDLWHLTRQRP